jgi:S1-C subfamily serine protease
MSGYLNLHHPLPDAKTLFVSVVTAGIAFFSGLILAYFLLETSSNVSTLQTSSPALPPQQLEQPDPVLGEDQVLTAYDKALTHIYEKAVPSVVDLDVIRQSPDGQTDSGHGSGFVWDKAGHLVTNYHIVQGAKLINVTFADGASLKAEVLATDPLADLAVLWVEHDPAPLQPLPLGDSNALEVGQMTLAIGSPFGRKFTMSRGIISALDRTISTCAGCYPIPGAIQTDTPINPGNSGGPLLNQRGEAIGINTLMISQGGVNTGLSFAIPINMAKQLVPVLIGRRAFQFGVEFISELNFQI